MDNAKSKLAESEARCNKVLADVCRENPEAGDWLYWVDLLAHELDDLVDGDTASNGNSLCMLVYRTIQVAVHPFFQKQQAALLPVLISALGQYWQSIKGNKDERFTDWYLAESMAQVSFTVAAICGGVDGVCRVAEAWMDATLERQGLPKQLPNNRMR